MKTSWSQCTQFVTIAQAHLTRMKDRETKLTYAIKRVVSRIQKQQATVNEALADIEIDHCLTEKRGDVEVITRDAQGNLQYTREGIKERNKKTREYLNSSNVEIEPYFATSLPADLNEFEIEAFAGFVIDTEDAKRLLAKCEGQSDIVVEAETNGHQRQAVSAAV